MDEGNIGLAVKPGLTFATIEGFKGLENKYIALIDSASFDATPRDISLIYVGMSRARAGLFVVFDKALEDSVERAAKTNIAAVLSEQTAR